MRKKDEELKIDISDIFGGDVLAPPAAAQDSTGGETVAASPEQDAQFQEWMNTRNEALQTQSHDLEKKLHGSLHDSFPQAPDDQVAIPDEEPALVSEAVPTETVVAETQGGSAIDFSAPIAPPFMGGSGPSGPAGDVDPDKDAEKAQADQEAEMKKLKSEHEFLMLYDEFRNIILFELKDLVGEKKAFTMLSRTVELAREQFPEIFRKTNWDPNGNLLEDGSVDPQRVIDNKNAMGFPRGEETLDAALSALLKLRMQAVEKGLGTGLKNKIRARMYQWITEKGKKSGADGKPSKDVQRLSGYIMLI